ncbi:MAG: diguanylate cyclase [Tepidisphaeraceae bacterium]
MKPVVLSTLTNADEFDSGGWRIVMNAKSKLLLIDDVKMMHNLVQTRLAQDEFEFHSAFSGEQGIAMAWEIHPDVILLDVEMPAPDGFEVCRRLKNDPTLSNIPVIFLTAVTSTEQKIRGLNVGAIDFITKPFDAGELQARLRVALRTKELLDLLSKKAMIDGLTGLWNRGYLDERVSEEIAWAKRHGRRLSCVMIDADHFKSVNDTYGHGFGDIVLRGIATAIQDCCRTEDVACRYGGEEFVLLLRETDAMSALKLAERIRTTIAAMTFTRDDISIKVTCSLGIAELQPSETDIIDLADSALYTSKQNGRNRVTIATPKCIAA